MIIGYSNLSILLSRMKVFEEFKTNKLATNIKILKKFEKASLIKLSRKIFSVIFVEFKIIVITIIMIIVDKLNIKLKLFLINTPIIKILKIEKVKKISGNKIFKLLIFSC